MGSGSSKDVLQEPRIKELDISHYLSPTEYLKHANGECLEGSLLELPWEMYYSTLSFYESVNASFNFISSIPYELSLHVPHLRYLDLSHNQLCSLPSTLQLLLHLRELRLSHNRLKQFPSNAVVHLPLLHTLDLSHNNIKELPQQDCWHHMKMLERLNISYNPLQLLPNTLSTAPKLSVLVVRGNELMHPPPHVCSQGSRAIMEYLRLHNTSKPLLSPIAPVFKRVRGDHMSASVSNPESARRQYQQGSYTGPGNKRKCPLMPPKGCTTLSPHALTQALMGLVYGAVVAESVGLSCEGLSPSEAAFYFNSDSLGPQNKVRDHLRSHFSKDDWGPNADLLLITLESILRWGGVVDELDWAAQVHQWMMQGFSDVDEKPGEPLSPFLKKVFSLEGYAINPHSVARAVSTQHSSAQPSDAAVVDSFSVTPAAAQGDENPPPNPILHAHDNSCLPPALVLGLSSFNQYEEVRSNAERICCSSHSSAVARSSCAFIASLVAAVLQGELQSKTALEVESLLNNLLEASVSSSDAEFLLRAWRSDGDPSLPPSNIPSCHVSHSLLLIKATVLQYCRQLPDLNNFTTLINTDGRSSRQSSSSEGGATLDGSPQHHSTTQSTSQRRPSDASPVGAPSDPPPTTVVTSSRATTDSDPSSQARVTPQPTPQLLSPSALALVAAVPLDGLFKDMIAQVCLKGGWGVCAHACVVGGVLGAIGGFNSLPKDWLMQLGEANRNYLSIKINLLLDMFGLP